PAETPTAETGRIAAMSHYKTSCFRVASPFGRVDRYVCAIVVCGWISLLSPAFMTAQEVPDEAEPVSNEGVCDDSFEDDRTKWVREEVDAPVDWLMHDRSDEAARDGSSSERFVFQAGPGGGVYASYAVP